MGVSMHVIRMCLCDVYEMKLLAVIIQAKKQVNIQFSQIEATNIIVLCKGRL